MAQKSFTFHFTFGDVAAAHAQQAVTATGSSLSVALNRATAIVTKRDHVKGHRINSGSIKFWYNGVENQAEESEKKDASW